MGKEDPERSTGGEPDENRAAVLPRNPAYAEQEEVKEQTIVNRRRTQTDADK